MADVTLDVDTGELDEHTAGADEVADQLLDELVDAAAETDGAALPSEYDWKDDVTWDEVEESLRRRVNATPSVTFTSTSDPSSWGDTGFGGNRPRESECIETMDGQSRYRIGCAGCGGVGEVTVTHGWNAYFECDECGTVNRQSG